jgi:hypothetical protein
MKLSLLFMRPCSSTLVEVLLVGLQLLVHYKLSPLGRDELAEELEGAFRAVMLDGFAASFRGSAIILRQLNHILWFRLQIRHIADREGRNV